MTNSTRRPASDLANGVERLPAHFAWAIFRPPPGSTRHATRKHSEVKRFRVPFPSIVGDELPGPEDIDRVTDAVIECGTGEEFIERVRTA